MTKAIASSLNYVGASAPSGAHAQAINGTIGISVLLCSQA